LVPIHLIGKRTGKSYDHLPAGAPLAISWFPTTVGGVILFFFVLLAVSWWLMGKVFRERDLTTLIFRGMVSVLVCIGFGFFQRSLADLIRRGPLNSALRNEGGGGCAPPAEYAAMGGGGGL